MNIVCPGLSSTRHLSNFVVDSDVLHLTVAGTHLVVVNSQEAAIELFEKRSAIYSDRVRHLSKLLLKHI